MRSVIKIISVAVTAVLLVAAAPARRATAETTYFSTRSVLADFFPKSERVTFRTYALDAPLKARLAQRLGYRPAKDRYTVFVATSKGKIDGYAVIDDEMGQHLPITFATRLSSRAVVERLEIMIYRETRGDEVRDARFRRQFEGKTAQDALRLNHDVDAVSGATISSASLAVGVRRAAVLVEELAIGLGALATAPVPAAPAAPAGRAPATRNAPIR
ncbi:MAG TPA: FMN-binding protein [Polyangia bacterium]|nr:FMN-binding protein [Polyangia bacterium]